MQQIKQKFFLPFQSLAVLPLVRNDEIDFIMLQMNRYRGGDSKEQRQQTRFVTSQMPCLNQIIIDLVYICFEQTMV